MKIDLPLLDGIDPDTDWIEFENRKFDNERVVVDNCQFAHCQFVRCTLIYSGGPCGFLDCEVDVESVVALTGAAYRGYQLRQKLDERPTPFPPMA